MILWVDDDTETSLRPYIDELEENEYEIIRVKNPDELVDIARNNCQRISIIIMDIILPIGSIVDSVKARGGIETGLCLIEMIKNDMRFIKLRNIPIVVFTVKRDHDVFDQARRQNIPCLTKSETLPSELLQKIIEIDPNHSQ